MFKGLSDENCPRFSSSGRRSCHLKLGASSSFKSKSDNRRKYLKHFGYSYLTTTFDSDNASKILEKCNEKTHEKYADVINGERKTMLTCPPHFIYSSQLKSDFSVIESEMEKKIAEEKCKNELKEILNFRKIYLPQAGERNVFNPLIQ